jgi:hypothetical protein
VQLTVALAAASGRVGAVTVYTYESFIAALLASVTIYVVGFVMLPSVTCDGERELASRAGA